GMYTVAIAHAHQHRLRLALDGKMMADPDASDLHQAVVVEGQPLSLRPVYQESLTFSSFAPVLQRVDENRWWVGAQGRGRTAEIRATPGEAVRQAQELYARWAENDDKAWEKRAAQILKRVSRSLMHQYWAWQLQQAGYWDRGGGYLLADMHGHGTRFLDQPLGRRILRTNRVRATHITDALARRDNIKPPWAQPSEAIVWLAQVGVAP
ncbi:MAG: hypothetical protein GY831_10325, partial [Delftia sp.]|nr:hypothetical protein [Delftia sp.]